MAETRKPIDIKLPGIGGLNSFFDPQFIQDQESPSINNFLFDGGLLAPRKGSTLLVNPPSGETGAPLQLMLASTMDGIQVMVGVWANRFYAFDDASVQWIRINNTNVPTATGIYYGSASWLQSLNDARLYFGNGVDACQKWIVGTGTLLTTTAATDTVIHLTDSSRFPASGNLVVKGTSGEFVVVISANDGTGNITLSAPIGQVVPNGSVVAMDTTVPIGTGANHTPFPIGNIFQVFFRRIFIGNGITLNYSTDFDPENWDIIPTGTESESDMGGIEFIHDGFGPIVALHNFGTFLVIEKTDTISQFNIVISIDSSGDSLKQDQITPMVTSQSYGPVNSKAVGQINNALVYLTRNNGIVQVYPSYAGTVIGVQINVLSQNIQNLLTNGSFDFTNVRVAVKEQKVLFACAIRGSQVNTQVLIYDFIRKAWSLITGWSVQDWIVRNGELYYMDNNTGIVYQCFTNNYTDNNYPYPVEMFTKIFDGGEAAMPKTTGRVYVQGFMQTSADFFIDVLFNVGGSLRTQTFRINRNTKNLAFSPALTDMQGTFLQGTVPAGWADLLQIPDVHPFYCGLGVDMRQGAFNVQFRIYQKKGGSYFAVSIFAPFFAISPNFPPEIMISEMFTGQLNTNQVITTYNGATGIWIFDYQPLQLVNGANTVFNIPSASEVVVFADGIQMVAGVDYTFTNGNTITFINNSQPHDELSIDYLSIQTIPINGGTGTWAFNYTPAQTVNGVNTVFTVPVASQVVVYADGLRVEGNGADYIFTGGNTITFVNNAQPFSSLSVYYLSVV